MQTSSSIAKIAPDLVKALSELEGAAKNSANPHFRSTYANLAAVVDGSRDILAKHNLAAMQGMGEVNDGRLFLTTRILHASGEWVESTSSMPLAKQDPQATLAALTYLRRGSLMALLGMPAVDDDGETAMGRGEAKKPAEKPVSAYQAKKDGKGERYNVAKNALQDCASMTELGMWTKEYADEIKGFPEPWQAELREEYTIQRGEIEKLVAKQEQPA